MLALIALLTAESQALDDVRLQQDVVWSADGQWLAYSELSDPANYDEENWSVWIVRSDGSMRRAVAKRALWVALSPDGKRLAYTLKRGGSRDIYVRNLETDEVRRLTTSPANNIQPAWSPDGRHIAFSSDAGGNYDVWVMRPDGSSAHRLTGDSGGDYTPKWSPDGKLLVFYRAKGDHLDQVWTIDPSTRRERLMTGGKNHNVSPCFVGPDRIAFFSSGYGLGVFPVCNLEGEFVRTIELTDGFIVSWSASSQEYAYLAHRSPGSEVHIKSMKDGKVRKVTGSPIDASAVPPRADPSPALRTERLGKLS